MVDTQTTHSHSQKKTASLWQSTHFANLVRYAPSGTYFARVRVAGKLIRRSLNTDVLSVAKLRLDDFQKEHRKLAANQEAAQKGRMTFGEVLKRYEVATANDPTLKPSSKLYRAEILIALRKSWPGIETLEIQRITDADCIKWAQQFGQRYSATRYNAALGVVKAVFNEAVRAGAVYRNPIKEMLAQKDLKRAKVRAKDLKLPDHAQFARFVREIEQAGSRESKNCADLVRFLAFGGFRISEARQVTWADCDLKRGLIIVRGDPETGPKNREIRRVPMTAEMRELLIRLRQSSPEALEQTGVMRVHECQKAMDRAAKIVGMARITHHDLRHLFATRCIESGVDIPTVSHWLGHKDGGALAMRTYGHLRDHHSQSMAAQVRFLEEAPAAAQPPRPIDNPRS